VVDPARKGSAVNRKERTSEMLAGGRLDEIVPLVYDELRGIAAAYMRRERIGHSLQPTALANEAYLRLVDETRIEWRGRAQFLAIAARAMRRILVEHARARGTAKRGGDRDRVSLSDSSGVFTAPQVDVLDLDETLEALARVDPRKAQIVELRFFAGLTTEETAEALGLSTTTVEDDWYFARAWLRRRLGEA
jgi:RNA polymerase sigma factor (TIGR02999 family)